MKRLNQMTRKEWNRYCQSHRVCKSCGKALPSNMDESSLVVTNDGLFCNMACCAEWCEAYSCLCK